MHDLLVLFGILGAVAVGIVSPGPSFVLVSRIAVTGSRLDGLAAALGMGLGGALFGTLALAGLTALLQQVEWLYLVLKVAGGLYLVWIGLRIWLRAAQPLATPQEAAVARAGSAGKAFRIALITQVSNPKAAIVYGSVFAAFLPPAPLGWLLVALPPLLFLMEAGWYAIVALAFSSRGPRAAYLGWKTWIDRVAGGVMALLGLRLIGESLAAAVARR